MKKIQTKISFGATLLIFSALANLARWIGVFTISEDTPKWVSDMIPILGVFSGLVSGLSVAGGLAFIFHRLGGIQPFTPKGKPIVRFWGSLVLGIMIVVMSAFLLPPYVRMMTPDELRIEIPDLNTWSIMSVLVGDLIIVAIALSDSKAAGFTRQPEQLDGKTESKESKKKGKQKQVARKPITDEALLAYLAANKEETQKQVAAHFGVTRQAIGARIKTLYAVKG